MKVRQLPTETPPEGVTEPQGTVAFLLIAVSLTGVIFACLVYGIYYSYSTHISLRQRALRIQELRGVIAHLDEVLTMSARMAATTGNLDWEERYRQFEPQLDAAIKEAISLAPGTSSAASAAQTDAANIALVALEHSAFQLVREHRAQEAQAVLFSPAYEAQKHIYAEGMQQFIATLGSYLQAEARAEWHKITWAGAGFMVLLTLSIWAWIAVTRCLFRSRALLWHHLTERRRIEAAIRKSEAYRNLFKHANDAILVLDPETEIVLDINDKACEVYGIARETFIGRSLRELTHETSRDTLGLQRLLVDSPYQEFEAVQCRADGTPINVLVNASLIEFQGHPAVLSINRDITERRRAEILLQEERALLARHVAERTADLSAANAELEHANRLKSEFLANMSHELRTPLHAILSFSGFGLKRATTAPPTKLREYFQHIDQNGRVLLLLLNDLLDLAKWEAGRMPCDYQPSDLSLLLRTVLDECNSLSTERGLVIDASPFHSRVDLLLDPAKIMQLLRNLINNAIKFSPDGASIELSLHQETMSVVVGVHDRGVGIPDNELVTIFDQFVQSSRTKTGAGGTGLGLAICREIVTAHHGRIWAEPRPGGGTSLFFMLPRCRPHEEHATPGERTAREPETAQTPGSAGSPLAPLGTSVHGPNHAPTAPRVRQCTGPTQMLS